MLVITEPFRRLAATLLAARGGPAIQLLVLPHPIGGRPPAEVDAIGRTFAEAVRAWNPTGG